MGRKMSWLWEYVEFVQHQMELLTKLELQENIWELSVYIMVDAVREIDSAIQGYQ